MTNLTNKGGYYNLMGSTATFVDSSGWITQVIEVSDGDIFSIKIRGGDTQIPWGFVDSEYRVLLKCTNVFADNEKVVAPQNSAYLILNSLSSSWPAYVEPKVVNIKSKFDEIKEVTGDYGDLDVLSNIRRTKNLINIEDKDVMYGYRQYSEYPDPNLSYNLTGFIKVEEGKSYIYSNYNKSYPNVTYVSYFDKNKKIVTYNTGKTIIEIPNGVEYVRLSIRIEGWDMIQLEEGSIATSYEPYGIKVESPVAIMFPKAVFPSKIYLIEGKEYSVYHKNYLDKWVPNLYTVAGNEQVSSYNWKTLERCFRTNGENDNPLLFRLYSVEDLTVVQKASINTILSSSTKGSSTLSINTIGDSFTYDGRWLSMVNECCPNINTIGMRTPAMDKNLKCEGRGGWHLAYYFKPFISINESFSPFVHPEGFNYYGVVEFWKSLVNNNATIAYATNGFDTYTNMFDVNGYKKNPSVNDLMYSYADSVFKYWDGSSWVISNVTEADFKFDYAKYIRVWGISSPDVVVVMLGKNDFWFSMTDEVWNKWKEQMDAVISSVHSYNSSIKIAICTPTTADVMPNNAANLNHILGHRRMWEARKRMIEVYDNPQMESSNVYLVDSGVVLDPDYGFEIRKDKPFEYYEGEEVELFDTSTVHPSGAGYKQIGVSVGAFIQYVRG